MLIEKKFTRVTNSPARKISEDELDYQLGEAAYHLQQAENCMHEYFRHLEAHLEHRKLAKQEMLSRGKYA